jgi:hypothetical protein
MGRLENLEEWLEDHVLIVCAVTLVILLALLGITCFVSSTHDDRAAWDDFADQVNKDTDYYLDKGYNGTCGYIKTIGSEYSTTIYVSQSSPETNYARVYVKESCLALEWHRITSSKEDTITSTTYIPYESICYVQANKVV